MNHNLILATLFTLASTSLSAGTIGPIENVSNFGGLYAGLGTGMMTVYSYDKYTVTRPGFGVVRSGSISSTNSATLFSGQLGYGKMFNTRAYLGAKASVYYTPLRQTNQNSYNAPRGPNVLSSGQDTIKRSLKPIYNIDAVLGYAIYPNLLPFVEGGVSFVDVKHQFLLTGTLTDLSTSLVDSYAGTTVLNKYKTSFNVGIGANCLLHQNWILSGELVYTNLAKTRIVPTTIVTQLGVPATHNRQETNNAVSLLFGVSYLFGR